MSDQKPDQDTSLDQIPADSSVKSQSSDSIISEFREIVETLTVSLGATAAQIRQNRFQSDGIGSVGTLFRTLSSARDTDADEECWSLTLELSSLLWREDFHDASVKLLRDAQVRLSPPSIFQDSIADSISFGEDYILFLKAKMRFEEGDEDGARGLVGKMSEENRRNMENELQKKSSSRQKSRRTAFVAAGVAGSFCIIASIMSLFLLRDLVRHPHTMSLPDIDISASIPKFEFEIPASTQPPQKSSVDPGHIPQILPEAEDPDVPSAEVQPAKDQEETGPVVEDIFGDSEVIPKEPVKAPAAQDVPAIDDDPALTDAAPVAREAPRTIAVNPDTLKQCGLAFRISSEVHRLADISDKDHHIRKAQDFQNTFLSACQTVPAEMVKGASEVYPEDLIANYAERILSGE